MSSRNGRFDDLLKPLTRDGTKLKFLSMVLLLFLAVFLLNAGISVAGEKEDEAEGGQSDKMQDYMAMTLEELLEQDVMIFSPGVEGKRNIRSVPGVITIITRDDIKKHGWRTLSDAILSIPGFARLQNDDEYLYPPRGIYATTNQKVLVMRDSHVLNEPNLDLVHLDYSHSLDSIERIEVIRGPGASIYGNAAMAAVINIVTRKGNFTSGRVRVGNYGQIDYDSTVARETDDYRYTIYGRVSNADGEERTIPAEEDPSTENPKEGVNRTGEYPRNYDIGAIIEHDVRENGELSFAANFRHDDMRIHWGLTGENTIADELVHEPGFDMDSTHLNLKYSHSFSDALKSSFNHYYDYVDLFITKNLGEITDEEPRGLTQDVRWKTQKLGLTYSLSYQQNEELSYLAGVNYEWRDYGDNGIERFYTTQSEPIPFFLEGSDTRWAGFGEVDYTPLNWLEVVAGLRYDGFSDYDSSVNPRVAIISPFAEEWSAKLIYTTAFQTPGYSYQNSAAEESGSITALQPEELTSYQAVLRHQDGDGRYYVEGTYFINQMDDLIIKPGAYRVNAGEFATNGFEIEARTQIGRLDLRGFYAYLEPDTGRIDETTAASKLYGDELRNLPANTVYLSSTINVTKKFDFNINGRWESGFYNKNDVKEDSKFLVDTTFYAKSVVGNIDFTLSIYNLFDEQYKLGDDGLAPVPQQGRWFLFGIATQF